MAAPRPHPNALVWLLLSAAIIGLDQWSKAWVLSSLPEFQPVVVIDGFWNWYRTYNTGAAFSFLSDAGGWQKHFFTVLAIVISGLMAWWLRGTARGNWKAAVPYALIIGGAIGNVIDRFVHGEVVDFLLVHWFDRWYFPAFNVADSAITVGAVLLILDELLRVRNSR